MKRKVYIKLQGDSWAVCYADRKRRGRYWAACFYAQDHTKDKVEQWVRENPKLELIERP